MQRKLPIDQQKQILKKNQLLMIPHRMLKTTSRLPYM